MVSVSVCVLLSVSIVDSSGGGGGAGYILVPVLPPVLPLITVNCVSYSGAILEITKI